MEEYEVMLTTVDNPYDYWDEFDKWFLYDTTNGYNTLGKLAAVSYGAVSLTEEENNFYIEQAIDDIIVHDFTNIYKKVKRKID